MPAAIDDERLPGDEIRTIRQKENNRAGEVLGDLPARNGPALDENFFFGVETFAALGGEAVAARETGGNAVNADAMRPQCPREDAGHRDDSPLRDDVVRWLGDAPEVSAGSDVDDFSATHRRGSS